MSLDGRCQDAPSEFVTEAQEVIETFSAGLLAIESALRRGVDEVDPELVNGAFRAVHSLKGLAALSGEDGIVSLAHALESTLDDLRLGRRTLDQPLLDVLFECVDTFGRLLARLEDHAGPPVDVAALLRRIASEAPGPSTDVAADALLDPALLEVLTEYEEHRLRENLRLGRRLFRVHADFDLLAIDVGIESLKSRLKAYGEVITYLPSAESTADDRLELDVVLGSRATLAEIATGVGGTFTVHELGPGKADHRAGGRDVVRASPEDEPREGTTRGAGAAVPTPPGTELRPSASRSNASTQGRDSASAHTTVSTAGELPDGEGFIRAAPRREDPPTRAGYGPETVDADVGEQSLRSLSQTVRVDLRRLDHLMNLVGELGLVHANLRVALEQLPNALDPRAGTAAELGSRLDEQVRVMGRRLATLREGILDVRMVPLGQLFDKLARVVRKLGREAGKDVRLTITGADTELDKLIVEELSDPLMHMIRNALDHGIEPRDERIAAGKPPAGRVELCAMQRGNRVVVEVSDDGRGLDWRHVRDVAVTRGFVSAQEARELTPSQAIDLIFLPGFSTRDRASELSGRGVGMDVVRTNVARLSGMIDVRSELGRGASFSITLPITLAIVQALVVECATQVFCIPLNSVLESLIVQRDDLSTIEGREVVTLRGRTLPLVSLSRIFQLEQLGDGLRGHSDRLYVVVVGVAQHRVGLVVDDLLGQEDVVIKPLGKALQQIRGIAGATELGANRTVLLLDVATLVAEAIGGDDEPGVHHGR